MNQNIVINTFNESSLHQTLKNMYAIQTEGQTEVQAENYIYDVIAADGTIIEIQTKNLSSLLPKISATLEEGKKVVIVHPVIVVKRIHTIDKDGKILSNRRSPKKGSIYDIFRELTGIYPILLNKNFKLEILEITMTETRLKTDSNVQSKNNRRRFKKDWIKINKKLDEIICIRNFTSKEDYLALLPETLPEEFTSKDLTAELKKKFNASIYNQSHLMLWVLQRMDLIKITKTEKRLRYFKISK